jgi:curli biogenesis system outer membrane secretion channel CsgG
MQTYILDLRVVNTKVGEIVRCPVVQRKENTSAVVRPLTQRKNMKPI